MSGGKEWFVGHLSTSFTGLTQTGPAAAGDAGAGEEV